MARLWRAYCAELPRTPGAELELSQEEAHHVGRVLRLGPGDQLSVFDGRGYECGARVLALQGGRVTVQLEGEFEDRIEAALEITVFQAVCRAERMEWAIQKATEMGVAAIRLVITERSQKRMPGTSKLARWRRIAIEAAKQSGRRVVPTIEPCAGLPRGDDALAILLHAGPSSFPLGELLVEGPPRRVWLAAGPESGFGVEEVTRWEAQGWRVAGLGPRTLRAETAAVVAVSVILHTWGDLGGTPA
jgi:16S rRNA (uracil1498-N3)-methyltransferase